jgi:histidinol-phosphatase (PHP family)
MHLEEGGFSRDWLLRFLERAREAGVEEVAFTEHSYRFRQARGCLDNDWARARQTEDVEEYVRLVLQAREEGYPVLLGIEMDYVEGKEEEIARFLAPYPWDLVLGSVHWLGDFGLDLDPRDWGGREVEGVWREYFRLLSRAAESGLFQVLSHPDLVKIFGFRPASLPLEEMERAAESAAARGVCFEVSSAGLRKPCGEIYPSLELLSLARRYGVGITLAPVSHLPEHVCVDLAKRVRNARSAGIRELVRFRGRVPRTEALG